MVTDIADALKERLTELRRRGYNRLYQQKAGEVVGKIVEFSTPESLLELDFKQPIFVLIDRLAISGEVRARIVDAIETGYRESGEVQFHTVPREETEEAKRLRYSAAFECTTCKRAYREPEPRLFSFNNPFGACPRCQGFGNTIDFDPNLIIPDKSKTLDEGAVAPWTTTEVSAVPWRDEACGEGCGDSDRCAVVRSDAERSRPLLKRARAAFRAFAASSRTSSARSTSCMCACFCRSIAAMRSARSARDSGCARRRVRC